MQFRVSEEDSESRTGRTLPAGYALALHSNSLAERRVTRASQSVSLPRTLGAGAMRLEDPCGFLLVQERRGPVPFEDACDSYTGPLTGVEGARPGRRGLPSVGGATARVRCVVVQGFGADESMQGRPCAASSAALWATCCLFNWHSVTADTSE